MFDKLGLSPTSPREKRLEKLQKSLARSVANSKSKAEASRAMLPGEEISLTPNLVDRLAVALRKKLQQMSIIDVSASDDSDGEGVSSRPQSAEDTSVPSSTTSVGGWRRVTEDQNFDKEKYDQINEERFKFKMRQIHLRAGSTQILPAPVGLS